ncbi:MAG: MOSC domain-containing protein [Rhodobacteraceae bacterium]|nr:MOSC domain-containing protein [Paracoccaceae bacterium]
MPALKPTTYSGTVRWIGRVADREATLASAPLEKVEITFEGISGESHGGLTRSSCSRVKSQHPRGTEIRNTRQLSVVSAEELSAIATKMGVESLSPHQIGASLMIEGLPDFTHLPPSSRLQGPSGVTFIVDMENRPCHLPAPVINETDPGKGGKFRSAAEGMRGVTVSVEREGELAVGDVLTLHIPDQRAWAQLEDVRGA